jgi:hypothetical protein
MKRLNPEIQMNSTHTSCSTQADGEKASISLADLDAVENVLNFLTSDEALESSAGASVEGIMTLAAGSYCLTCPPSFD